MATLEITLQRGSAGGRPVVALLRSPDDLPVRRESTLILDQVEVRSQLSAQAYGEVLGRALWRDGVRDLLTRAQARYPRLRILLFIEDPELLAMHWERLCGPFEDGWHHLRLDHRTPFAQYLPSLTDRRYPAIGRSDLRMLLLVAGPDGLDQAGFAPFDPEAAAAGVRSASDGIECDVLARIPGALGPPTLDALCECLAGGPYTIVHLICHGAWSGSGAESVVMLESGGGAIAPVTATRLVRRLETLQGEKGLPHLAFLTMCESARPDAGRVAGGLAHRLVRDLGTPAVVAMTDRVTMRTAERVAAGFYRHLRAHGQVDLALTEATSAVAEHGDVTVPSLFTRLGDRPLFSDTLDRPLTPRELDQGVTQLHRLIQRHAPVLDAQFVRAGTVVRGTLRATPSALSPAAAAERDDALATLDRLSTEVADLSFTALALGQKPPPYDARCPFRGLYPFRAADQEFFFGRDALVAKLRRRLAAARFLPVLGPSGCGKSSLVLAGLVPSLSLPPNAVALFSPGTNPSAHLEAAVAEAGGDPALVVVDQLEELFTLGCPEGERRGFLGRLTALRESVPVVLTMRADFWGECAVYREFSDLMQRHQELVPPMDDVELRRAIEQQATAAGLRFEGDLAARIVDDVRDEAGAMPLLQHALLELWKRRHGTWLTAEEYRVLGGVQQAISRTAERVHATLTPPEQNQVRDIFVRLTRMDEDAVHPEDRRDTRRRVPLAELVPAGADPALTKTLVTRLATERLLVTSTNVATRQEEVEVSHEALIRKWALLQRWLEEDRTALRAREGLRRAALDWQGSGRDAAFLVHRGRRLDEARTLSGHPRLLLNRVEQDYLLASEQADERYRPWEAEAEFPVATNWFDPDHEAVGRLDVTVRRRRDERYPAGPGPGRAVAPLTLEPGRLAAVATDPAAYGRLLSAGFFADPELRRAVVAGLDAAKRADRPFALRMTIDPGAAELHTVHWELLRHPDDDRPLLREHRAAFTRLTARSRVKIHPRWQPGALDVRRAVADEAIRNAEAGDVLILTCSARAMADGAGLASALRPVGSGLIVLVVQAGTDLVETTAFAEEMTRHHCPAVVVLPPAVGDQTREEFLAATIRQMESGANVDWAVAVGRHAVRHRPEWWMPRLFTAFGSGRLWYVPRILNRAGFDTDWTKWMLLIRSGQCTPVLGPGVAPPWAVTTAIAQIAGAPDRAGLSGVAQAMRDSLSDRDVRRLIVDHHQRARDLEQHRPDPGKAHRLLARLPFPIYVTTNPDDSLLAALDEVGRRPVVRCLPWRDQERPSRDESGLPTVGSPLVFQIFGSFTAPETLVLTEDDTYEFLAFFASSRDYLSPRLLMTLVRSPLLFLGLDPDDQSGRTLWRGLQALRGGGLAPHREGHLIQREPAENDTRPRPAFRWNAQAPFEIYEGTALEFLQDLARQMTVSAATDTR